MPFSNQKHATFSSHCISVAYCDLIIFPKHRSVRLATQRVRLRTMGALCKCMDYSGFWSHGSDNSSAQICAPAKNTVNHDKRRSTCTNALLVLSLHPYSLMPMKSFTLFLAVLFGFSFARAQQRCNHGVTHQHSAVADTVDAIHYQVHLQNIDFANQEMTAQTTVKLRPKLETSIIPLELKALTVTQVSCADHVVTAFAQSGDVLHISFAESLLPTDTVDVVVDYNGTPFHEDWGGFHFSGDYAFNLGVGFVSDPHNLGKAWFPCVDDFLDRATYDVLITLPNALKGIGGGSFVGVTDNGNGSSTWQWHIAQPIPTYLASATAGDYALNSDVYPGLNGDIPITIYTRPSDSVKVEGSFANLHAVMDFFENRFGPYPFDRIGYSGTAIGAMEHVANISYPHFAISGNLNYEYLYTHELSHMWFGNKVTCASAQDMWLNEGWATFCQYFYKHDLYNPEIYRAEMNDNHYDILKNAHITDGGYYALNNIPTNITYGTTVYDQGATVVHTLMYYLGQEVFFDAIKAYLQAYAFAPASSENLRDFLTTYTGRDMTGFFDTWVFAPGTPHYSIDSFAVNPIGELFETRLFVKQKQKGSDHIGFGHQFEVSLMGSNWQLYTDTVRFDGATGEAAFVTDFAPVLALADVYDHTLDATSDKDLVLRQTGETAFTEAGFRLYVDAIADSSFFRLTHHWVAPDSLKTPVAGLRLSPYRYWEVAGIFDNQPSLRGRFFYSNGATLDAGLISSEQDSVVLLYRSNSAAEWQHIPQSVQGLWNIGYIYVDDLQPGQYTLAVWDKQIVGLSENPHPSPFGPLQIFPNPATETVAIQWAEPSTGKILITDQQGQLKQSLDFADTNRLALDIANYARGLYLVEQQNLKGNTMSVSKLIVR